MIHPDNNVAVRTSEARPPAAHRYRQSPPASRWHRSRSGDRRRRNAGVGHRRFNAGTPPARSHGSTARPCFGAAKQGYFGRVGEELARKVPRRARCRTDIHANNVLRIVCITSSHRLAVVRDPRCSAGSNVAHGDVFRTRHHKQHRLRHFNRLHQAVGQRFVHFGGQSSSRAVTTGPGSTAPTRTPYCATGDEWCAQCLHREFRRGIDRLPDHGTTPAIELVKISPDLRDQMRQDAAHAAEGGVDKVQHAVPTSVASATGPPIGAGVGVEDIETPVLAKCPAVGYRPVRPSGRPAGRRRFRQVRRPVC